MARPHEPYWHPTKRRWRVRINGEDKWAPREIGPKDKAEAWAWMRRVLGEAPGPGERGDITVRQLCNEYLHFLAGKVSAGRHSAGAMKGDRTHLGHFLASLGARPLPAAAIHRGHVERFLEWAEGAGYSDNYRRNMVKSIQAAFSWAAARVVGRTPEVILAVNPLRGMPRPRVARANRYVDPAAVRAFLRLFGGMGRATTRRSCREGNRSAAVAIRFMFVAGCRPGEACQLRWSDLDRRRGIFVLPWDRHKTGDKVKADRTIYVTPPVERILRALEAVGVREDGFLFGHLGGPYNAQVIGRKIRDWREAVERRRAAWGAIVEFLEAEGGADAAWLRWASGVLADMDRAVDGGDIVAYTMRHNYCTDALLAGASYADLAKMVGNSPSTLEQKYDHHVHDRLRERAAAIAARRRAGR